MIAKAIGVSLSGEKAAQNHTNAPSWQAKGGVPGQSQARDKASLFRQRQTARPSHRGNQQHNLAFWRMRLVMREKLRGAPAPEFLKLFGQLASDTELPVLQNVDRGTERFY
jgi:hypothetical protein